MRFEFATAGRILFGQGTLREIGSSAAEVLADRRPQRALVVNGRTPEAAQPLIDHLRTAGIEATVLPVEGEPTTHTVEAGVRQAREQDCTIVIGFGGGSAIDVGKAVAAMATNPGELLDYLEVIGRGRPLARAPLPCIAVPTTAGTGAEVTRNAVLASPEHKVKVSLRSPLMLPRVAIVDPELTYDLPPAVTASTGLDALTQLIEPFVSVRGNPMTGSLCREGIMLASRSLRRACRDGHDASARQDMAMASLFSGLALANAGLGAAHGFAGPIGGEFPAPHGAVCAALLPHVMAVNVRALRARQPDGVALELYDEIAWLVTGGATFNADKAVAWVQKACNEAGIPPLRTYGITADDLPALVEKGRAASSMKGNPIVLQDEELAEILRLAL